MAISKEHLETIHELEEKLKDYLDVVTDNEADRIKISLLISFDMLVCSCPFDELTDVTTVSRKILKNRLSILQEMTEDYLKEHSL